MARPAGPPPPDDVLAKLRSAYSMRKDGMLLRDGEPAPVHFDHAHRHLRHRVWSPSRRDDFNLRVDHIRWFLEHGSWPVDLNEIA
jgi:hypothetical protein